MIKTLNLTANAEISIGNLGGDRCRIQNRTSGTLYVSDKPGITPCADGVMSIPSGRGDYFPYSMTSDTVYLLSAADGNVEVSGEHYYRPFDSAAGAGGEGEWDKLDDSAFTGNAKTVNGHTVKSDVPENAKFTDTITTIDSALSSDSTNPVQNAVITAALSEKADTSDIPTSLPANGGNADTVGGKSISDLASAEDAYWLYTYAANGNKHGETNRIKAVHNVKNDYRFYLQDENGYGVRVSMADDAGTVQGYTATDFLTRLPAVGMGTTTGTSASAVTLGYQPSILLVTSRQKSNGSVLLHQDHTSGDLTLGSADGTASATVTVTLTDTGFEVSAPGQDTAFPFDYMVFK